jgi:hypothetical protein
VRESFKTQLTPERIHEKLNQLSSLEHTLPIKIVPLAVKVPVLKNISWQEEKGASATFSNLGRVVMSEELSPYICSFSACSSTRRPYVCICSFGDHLVISFSSPFISSAVQRNFFRTLGGMGLDITVVSNTIEKREIPNPLPGAANVLLS